MYEIWLVLNILWELALAAAPLLLAGLAAWLALMVVASRRPNVGWRSGLAGAVLVAVVVGVAAFLLVPGWTRSSLGELRYWVDWVNLLGVALGFAVLAAGFAWPLFAMRRR